MSTESSGVVAEIIVGEGAHGSRSISPHRFLVLPRVGETIIVEDAGKELFLKIKGITHVGDPTELARETLARLPAKSVQLYCENS